MMNQFDHVNDMKMNARTVVMPTTTTDTDSSQICLNNTSPPRCFTTEDDFQPQSLSTLSLLSSSPTDVIHSSLSLSTTTMFQHHRPLPHHYHHHHPSVSSSWPTFPMSRKAQRTQNPIRAVIDPMLQLSNGSSSSSSSKNHGVGKVPISLALGDPMAAAATTSSSSSSFSEVSLPPPQSAESNHTSTTATTTTATTTTALSPCPLAIRAVIATMESDPTAAASYTNAIGTWEGRTAIARYHSHPPYSYTYNPESDIIIANGCSGALEILLTSLLDQSHPDDDGTTHPSILLVPAPGFPLYRVIAESHGATVVSYPLLPDRQWEIDLVQLRNIIEEQQQQQQQSREDGGNGRTNGPAIRGIVMNNPSNPTGAVYTTTHLQQIVRLCQQFFIPIIADEIYGDLIFPNDPSQNDNHNNDARPTFVSMARIAAEMGRIVPVVTASGIGKQFLLPGWRIGWICFQDNIYGSLQEVKDGAKRLAQIVLGASHLAQVAIPALLLTPPPPPPQVNDSFENGKTEILPYLEPDDLAEHRRSYSELMEWKDRVRRTLHQQSQVLCAALRQIGPCLQVIPPQGAMYAMVRIHLEYFDESTIPNDTEFATLLYQEEQVVVLPGTCFNFPNSFRVVFCAPVPILKEAAQRIHQFCHRHLRPSFQ